MKSFYVIYLGYAQILHCLFCHNCEKFCWWTDQTRAALCIHYDQNSTSTLDVHNLTMNDRTHLFKIRCQITYIHQSENFYDILKKCKKHRQVQYCRQFYVSWEFLIKGFNASCCRFIAVMYNFDGYIHFKCHQCLPWNDCGLSECKWSCHIQTWNQHKLEVKTEHVKF